MQEELKLLSPFGPAARGMKWIPARELLQTFTRLIDEGRIKVTAGKTFPLSEVQQAHEYGQSGHGRGRIVLQVADEAENNFT